MLVPKSNFEVVKAIESGSFYNTLFVGEIQHMFLPSMA